MIAVYSQPRTIQSILKYKKLAYSLFEILTTRHLKNVLDEEHYKKQFKRLDTFHHAINYIEQNYTENISVPELAARFNMSASYFAHFFKEYSQKSVIEYINETRITHAKNFLEKEDLPINDIALRVGFSDINYFSRKFKAVTGISPTEYKKTIKKPTPANK
jgi:AraC-like DNA-binding protein